MRRRKLILTIVAVVALTFAIITTSYGYWTDELKLSGEVGLEFRIPVINDMEIAPEVPLPEEQVKNAQPESEKVDMPGATTESNNDDEGGIPEAAPETTNEEQVESTEAEGFTIDESAKLQ